MSIHVALNHVTHYRYDKPVTLGPQVVRLRPCPHSRTRILAYSLRVLPENHFINWQQDPQANYLARLVFTKPAREFRVEVDLVVEMAVLNPFDFFLEPAAEHFPFTYDESLHHELAPYLQKMAGAAAAADQPSDSKFAAYLAAVPRTRKETNPWLFDLIQQLQRDIAYVVRLEPGVQTPEETLQKGSGSCRDSAWLLVQLLRHLGLAARFVSGYLIQLTPDVKSLDGLSGPPADFTDLHAWCEVYLPGAGWIGLDATSGLFAGEGHIPLACSPDPSSAAPVTGLVDECEVEFSHAMRVDRVWEAPRVTKPYSEATWQKIEALGHAIDRDIERQDIRLTMGGEPTFVAVDDPDAAEWNNDALGPNKRQRAGELFHRLREKYAPQGLMHYGQGKWYPGEQLPRWSLNCFWRKDGEPIWTRPELYADERRPGNPDAEVANAFLRCVAGLLKLDQQHVFDAYEDVFYYLWRERRLPSNVDPFDSRLDDPIERERLRRIFERGLAERAGAVLPVTRAPSGAWQSGSWFLRSERCYLLPGDSPLGLRLPLDSQPWVTKADYPYVNPPDPTQSFPPLRRHAEIARQFPHLAHANGTKGAADGKTARADRACTEAAPRPGQSAAAITRTAMCAEPRGGILYIFMPPTNSLDDYLELVSAVEATAAEFSQPVILEGYDPPFDPRLTHFRVTPDPGVIEVNIQPSKTWDELVERTTYLYEAAHLSRLTSEKFMLDGRHTGTGGGNHIVLGGATTNDSPFLRRPDLLRSLLSYWHNHPSLSYLFSGLFIGPTSQAPRIDEARNDSVREIEISFREMERRLHDGQLRAGQASLWPDGSAPWLIDRLLRNLLIDVSGNTHRAEFCIDKLYSPDGPAGRHGLLEMRAFEMPPHARMSLTQQLLLRALVTRFWRTPYAPERLVRWGTELHDRFMLPHFVEQDFADVIAETQAAGIPVEAAWFAPHFEFRFPKMGDFTAMGVEVELRHALEPWHVLGEEGANGTTARYVDSSLERLQVKVSGMPPERYRLAVNGVALPLQPTGQVGEFVAGVRYRAWQPSACLHPTIGVDSPLTFDLHDTWMNRSLGGAQYHVAHPGGRSYESFPVNAFEAESRRLSRFFRRGHTPGQGDPARPLGPAAADRDFPFTLDLRRA
jgi:uncharacterized protein (DUF2126 family)/transglutaminase-like putative cysteine protease